MVPGLGKQLSQMRRGAIEFCVLSLLHDEDRYGFDISRTLSASTGWSRARGPSTRCWPGFGKRATSRRAGTSPHRARRAVTTG